MYRHRYIGVLLCFLYPDYTGFAAIFQPCFCFISYTYENLPELFILSKYYLYFTN